jgi:hypothetical protein
MALDGYIFVVNDIFDNLFNKDIKPRQKTIRAADTWTKVVQSQIATKNKS